MSSELMPVDFHGDIIFCLEHEGQPYAPMKPIVENMGIAWQTQFRKLNDSGERWGITMMMIPSSGGDQKMLCIPVRKLPAWLSSINPKKVKPELREKIERYQAECDDVLWDYWINGKAKRRNAEKPGQVTIEELKKLYDDRLAGLASKKRKRIKNNIADRLCRHFGSASLPLIPTNRYEDARKLILAPIQEDVPYETIVSEAPRPARKEPTPPQDHDRVGNDALLIKTLARNCDLLERLLYQRSGDRNAEI